MEEGQTRLCSSIGTMLWAWVSSTHPASDLATQTVMGVAIEVDATPHRDTGAEVGEGEEEEEEEEDLAGKARHTGKYDNYGETSD